MEETIGWVTSLTVLEWTVLKSFLDTVLSKTCPCVLSKNSTISIPTFSMVKYMFNGFRNCKIQCNIEHLKCILFYLLVSLSNPSSNWNAEFSISRFKVENSSFTWINMNDRYWSHKKNCVWFVYYYIEPLCLLNVLQPALYLYVIGMVIIYF